MEQAAAEAVRHYLDALRAGSHLHTKHPSRRAIQRRLAEIEGELTKAPPMRELRLLQERHDLLERTRALKLEDAFVDAARSYSRRHGISFDTWREMGVPVSLLRKAGIRPRRA